MSDYPLCSFCGKSDATNLIEGRKAFICLECAKKCAQYGNSSTEESKKESEAFKTQTPSTIKKHLDQYVIGQDHSKKVLSVAVYNHYKRLQANNPSATKSNVLLVGDTGTGKTLLAQTLAEFIKVPLAIADATSLTEAGYVGEDVENILVRLLQMCNYDLKKAICGIIFVDEIDKISRKSESASITRDVSGEGVQQALLKIVEGAEVNIPPKGGRKHPDQQLIKINTKDILFIFGGAFEGLDKLIKQRIDGSAAGFLVDKEEKNKESSFQEDIHPEDLVKFGLIPELVGRMPIISRLQSLSKSDLVDILTKPKNSLLKQYETLFSMDGVELIFEEEALEEVAEESIKKNTGARGLKGAMERILLNSMYEVPDLDNVEQILVTKDVIVKGEDPLIYKKIED